MNGLWYLFAAYAIIWLVLLAYLALLMSKAGGLQKDIAALRDVINGQSAREG